MKKSSRSATCSSEKTPGVKFPDKNPAVSCAAEKRSLKAKRRNADITNSKRLLLSLRYAMKETTNKIIAKTADANEIKTPTSKMGKETAKTNRDASVIPKTDAFWFMENSL